MKYIIIMMILLSIMGCRDTIIKILSSVAGCNNHSDSKLVLFNNSKDTIYYSIILFNDSPAYYPVVEYQGEPYSHMLVPKEEYHLISLGGSWEDAINYRKDSTFRIYFFSKKLMKTASKDSIIKYRLCSESRRLKVKDLEKINWRIVYDGK